MHGATHTLRKRFHCKRMASVLKYMGERTLPFLQPESENQKSGPIKFLDFAHSACPRKNFDLICRTELTELFFSTFLVILNFPCNN